MCGLIFVHDINSSRQDHALLLPPVPSYRMYYSAVTFIADRECRYKAVMGTGVRPVVV